MTCYCCSRKATHRIYDDLKPVCTFHRDEALEEETQPILVMRIEEGIHDNKHIIKTAS